MRGRADCRAATFQPGQWPCQSGDKTTTSQAAYQQSYIVDRETLQKVGKAWLQLHRFAAENKETKYVAQDSEDGNCWNENPFYPKLNDIANTCWITIIFPGHLGPIQS